MKSLHVKKGDRVKVIAGKDKGTVGEVIAVDVANNRVTVQGVNIVKRHLRDSSTQPQQGRQTKGGIIASEAPIHASNVQPAVGSGKDVTGSRVGYRREEVTKRRPDGSEYTSSRSVRFLKKEAKAEAEAKPAKKAAKKKEADK
ncbi:50S ribosomal protein L24 [Aestuariimicrobium ganziense]|uniref:50S ribosomal protein L24 n=1 Tax=Aestuariimicrobium ganziense TaxID=2773677 RepID=UPI001940DE9A|nr:50S ribosomal protein L24 [Aestuariimicrobium ganziense]